MTLETTTYSAFHGYSWSSKPSCISEAKLNSLYRMISIARGDFPDSGTASVGLVSDGKIAAAFTSQDVPKWDAERRASNYTAIALFPVSQAANIDFLELLGDDFFWTPSRKPPTQLEYDGEISEPSTQAAVTNLQVKNRHTLRNPRSLGHLISKCGPRSSMWSCLLVDENCLRIECNRWTQVKGV